MKCDEIFDSVLTMQGGDDRTLFDLAQCFLDGYDPTKLTQLLRSGDPGVVSDGLFVLGEIGNLARQYATEVLALTGSADPEVRRKAEKLDAIFRPPSS